MAGLAVLAVLVGPLLAVAQPSPDTPAAVVRRYLELGSRGDAAGVRRLVESGCEDTPVGRAEAVTLLGARIALRSVRTRVAILAPAEARVHYTLTGPAAGTDTRTRILGATVHFGRVRASSVTRSGVLRVVRTDRGWRVSCRGS
jgi:hypothetical protein